ncbi:VTT domain-containing protein [Streptomyces sp. RFCAC02]|uniref:DedA family protein n=1 Tax=Streptomyces sp. RFCAC02 TaxID=2499143 RepID=UPI0010229BD2|nr:VTT domain-containing protein [Streptomyces sp. RFCAC02]
MDSALWMYVLLALTTAPPLVPNAALIASAGALAQAGDMSLPLVLLVVAGSALAGDALIYGCGVLGSRRALRWLSRTPRRSAALHWTASRMRAHGLPFVIGVRFVPSGRVVGALTAAVVGYPARRYLLGAGIAELIWASYSVGIGYWGGAALGGAWPSLFIGTGVSLVVAVVAQALSRCGGDKPDGRGSTPPRRPVPTPFVPDAPGGA